jgi:seryl-tRNA synthetase
MIDLKDYKENPKKYFDALKRRGPKFKEVITGLKSIHEHEDKESKRELELLQSQINAASKIIPELVDTEKKEKIAELKKVSDRIAEIKANLKADQETAEISMPNIPKPDVPDGADENDNVVEREVGEKPKLKDPKDYLALTEAQGLIDLKRASKVSGSRFGYILGPIAQLEFALVQYTQSVLLPQGFTLVVPPVLIKKENMAAMGYLSGGGEDETYHFEKDDLYLVGTSEQSIGPMHRDEVFKEEDLPKRYLSFSTCFRREAGSYGKDTKGILRVHQFDKLEMFSITLPEASDQEHEFLLAMEEKLMQGLELPYRVKKLCTGDLGWPSARTWDIETWMPGQGTYRETHSTSTTTDYQARELQIKVQRANGKEYVHMLNGTAFAIGRTLIGIIENYQQPDGSITIPTALQPWMSGLKKIGPL